MAKATKTQKQHFIRVPFNLPQHPDHRDHLDTPVYVRADAIIRLEPTDYNYKARNEQNEDVGFVEKGVRIHTRTAVEARIAVGVTMEEMLAKVNRALNLLEECPLLPEPEEETPKK